MRNLFWPNSSKEVSDVEAIEIHRREEIRDRPGFDSTVNSMCGRRHPDDGRRAGVGGGWGSGFLGLFLESEFVGVLPHGWTSSWYGAAVSCFLGSSPRSSYSMEIVPDFWSKKKWEA